MTMIDERLLREKTRKWLAEKYKGRYFLEPIILHDLKLTVSEFLRRHFKGQILTLIPRYNKMHVEPDIFGIIKLRRGLGIIVAECKVKQVTMRDFRQAMDYARTCQSYEAYLVYYGSLTEDVKRRVRSGNNFYEGLNNYGKLVLKKLILVEYKGNYTFHIISTL